MTFTETIDRIDQYHGSVFTPSAPIAESGLLKGREALLADVTRAFRRRGASIVLYGERGVGKTSVAKIVKGKIGQNGVYYSVSRSDTFETICVAILDNYGVAWADNVRQTTTGSNNSLSIKTGPIQGGVGNNSQLQFSQTALVPTAITPQFVSQKIPNGPGLIVLDDFERIGDTETRAKFADLVKKFSDNDVQKTLLFVGIADDIAELLHEHASAFRSLVQIRVPRLPNEHIESIIKDGMSALDIYIAQDKVSQIVEFSAQFPYYTHLLCEGAILSLIDSCRAGRKQTLTIEQGEISDSINYAIRNTESTISDSYNAAIQNIHQSPRFKHTLYAIASWPEEPVAYSDIADTVAKVSRIEGRRVNVSHQLRSLCRSKIIERTAVGFYRFHNPILKAYVILRAKADSRDAEIAAIDAHLKYVRRRLDRIGN